MYKPSKLQLLSHRIKCIFLIKGYFDDISVLVTLLALDFDLRDTFVFFVVKLIINKEFFELDPSVALKSIGLAVEDVLLLAEFRLFL